MPVLRDIRQKISRFNSSWRIFNSRGSMLDSVSIHNLTFSILLLREILLFFLVLAWSLLSSPLRCRCRTSVDSVVLSYSLSLPVHLLFSDLPLLKLSELSRWSCLLSSPSDTELLAMISRLLLTKSKSKICLTIENRIGSAFVRRATKDVKWVSLLFLLK